MSDLRAYQPTAPHQVVYQNIVRPPSNGAAVASLVLGVVAIAFGVWIPIPFLGLVMMFVSFVPAVLAVVFGHVGLGGAHRSGVGRNRAVAGLVTGYLTLGIAVLTTLAWVTAGVASAGH